MKLKTLFLTLGLALGIGVTTGVALSLNNAAKEEATKVDATTDYSSTIRVYFDISWSDIEYVRIGTDQASGEAALVSSDAKYNTELGNYVRDISSASAYDTMGLFFNQLGWDGGWYVCNNGGGWFPHASIDGYSGDEGFLPGYEYKVTNIGWGGYYGSNKSFTCTVYKIGEIRDNAQNSTFYLVDGDSWHLYTTPTAYFWGGTASCSAYPGEKMTDSGLRLKAFVGEEEFLLYVYQYTLDGSASYVKFSNNNQGEATGDLALDDGGIYFFGVSAEVYKPVAQLLVTLKEEMGSYTYKGQAFSKSICKLTQTQASAFVTTYKDLDENYGSGVTSSVEGSGIVTYDGIDPVPGHTDFVSLQEIRAQLIKRYPAIASLAKVSMIDITTGGNSSSNVVTIVAASLSVVAIGGYFYLRTRKQD